MKKGAYTLLITPFKKDYSLDEEALRQLIRMQVNSAITGIAPLGVTGSIRYETKFDYYSFHSFVLYCRRLSDTI